ncbi:glycosyltransferase family 2 protein [Thermophilibacter provencensis]|uniref:glycosyltransferase family 2 protein n=1 Tax=Thermophilibacter provencensis TaxID=1852386 RepID=UPI00094B5475|nr:glycosyltransferase family A protein [Thermophilibacter provencensis]
MNAEPLVSIVIPTLDAASVIRCSVASALRQSRSNIEVVVVDNGSSDRTRDVVREFSRGDSRVRLVDSGRTGVSHARNVGIAEARGDYIAFCDADDEMENDAISSLLGYAQDADIVAGGMSFDIVDAERRTVSSSVRRVVSPASARGKELGAYFEGLWTSNYLQSCCSKLFSLDFLRRSGMRFDERLSSYEDLSFVLDCLSHDARFMAVPDICYHYLRSTSETNSTRYKPDMTDQMENVAERVVTFYRTVLERGGDASCSEHIVQLLVVAVNNAQNTPGGGKAIRAAMADLFARRVFAEATSTATTYPNRYSKLVCSLASRRCYSAVEFLAWIRNRVRSVRVAS